MSRSKPKAQPASVGVVYVLEVTPKWHAHLRLVPKTGKSVLYVGETSRDFRERFDEHLTGQVLPGRIAKKKVAPISRMLRENSGAPLLEGVDLVARDDLAAPFNADPLTSTADNLRSEREAARALKKQGHIVFSNGAPKRRKKRAKSAASSAR